MTNFLTIGTCLDPISSQRYERLITTNVCAIHVEQPAWMLFFTGTVFWASATVFHIGPGVWTDDKHQGVFDVFVGDLPKSGAIQPNSTIQFRRNFWFFKFWFSVFSKYVLALSPGMDQMGSIRWQMLLILVIAWLSVFLCLSKGIKSSGKVNKQIHSTPIHE